MTRPETPKRKIGFHLKEKQASYGIEFRVTNQSQIAVEIIPGVPAFMKWPIKEAGQLAETASPLKVSGEAASMVSQINMFLEDEYRDSWKEGRAVIDNLEREARRLKSIWAVLSQSQDSDVQSRGRRKRH